MTNTVTAMQSSCPILGVKALQTFGALKQVAALSCLLAVAGAPTTLWAGKAPPPPPSNYPYSLRQLSLPAGASSFSANGLNNAGQVVGEADFPNNEWVGCLWQPNGQTVQLPLLPGAQVRRASAGSITDSGLLIAGSSVVYLNTNNANAFSYDGQRATFWTNSPTGFQACDWNDLMPPDLGIHLIHSEVSWDGQYVVLSGPDRQAGAAVATVIANIVYDSNESITGINVLDILENAQPQAINHDGAGVVRVLGHTSEQPFLWKKTAAGEISLLIAPYADIAAQDIGAVNKLGQVVDTYGDLYNTKALRWEETQLWDLTLAKDLGGFGGSLADARDINDAGVVVGAATLAGRTAPQRAYIFNNGSMTDLNTLAPVGTLVLQGANRINNSGEILAFATQSHSTTVSWVLLTPVNP
jgi:probable HAF family extracellular repeat protein